MNSPTISTTPTRISEQILRLCRQLDPHQEPRYVPVKPWIGGRADNCFYNVEDRIKVDGGDIQYGWTIWENPSVLVEGEFHAVWVSPSDKLVDITPKADGEKEILFLPDTNRVWERQMVENVRVPLVDNAYTRQLIRHSEAMFKLRVKYWDAESGISKIPLEEMQRLTYLDTAPSQSMPRVKVGRNQTCPCGSGKKYKKCHGA